VDDSEQREIWDRIEIQELMHRYAEMVDRRDWGAKDRIFALEATIDYTSAGGHKGPFREAIVWLERALERWPYSHHGVSNLIIELDGDRATARCYFNAPLGRDTADGSQEIITNIGFYEDRLVRTADGWRITERDCRQTMMLGALPEGYRIPS